MSARRKTKNRGQWRRVDLHIHTPASADFQESGVSYLDLLRQAEKRGMDIVAFTDHNTVKGYRTMRDEIAQLELLERLERLRPDERQTLDEYRRLLDKILVLPGFEFTAMFGFHILGIFSPQKTTREIEFVLRELNVPLEKLDSGSTEVGSTTDVLTAYRLIDEAGGLVIAAHANSTHGVALQGFAFGGQTRIAYTQDPHLHALEVTDLGKRGKRTTAHFFDGSKPEYPRRMHLIQGSDSHHLTRDPSNQKNLGVGDRATEVLLQEVSFEALRAVLTGNDFTLTRPFSGAGTAVAAFDPIRAAREAGPGIVQDFHAAYTKRGGHLYAIIADVCAFANTNGGTVYVGASGDVKEPPAGVSNTSQAMHLLEKEIEDRISPPLEVNTDVQESQGSKVIRIVVPRGTDVPYAIDENRIYVRSESETNLAVRDEIVSLVKRGLASVPEDATAPAPVDADVAVPSGSQIEPPRTGVEIVDRQERGGTPRYTVRDLRNGYVAQNVTRQSARKLWHYAITQAEEHQVDPAKVQWHGEIALLKKRQYGGRTRYDLAQRNDGDVRVYYGVTEDGIHGEWAQLLGEEIGNGETEA